MSKNTAWRPTPEQIAEGPVVSLVSERWAGMEWSPHGFGYNIIFDKQGKATVLKEHWDEWIDDAVALYDGIRKEEG
jgi:hypothetical protein